MENFPPRTFKPQRRIVGSLFEGLVGPLASLPQSVNARPKLSLPSACEVRVEEWSNRRDKRSWQNGLDDGRFGLSYLAQ